jgi:outer membrane immunogenic protein
MFKKLLAACAASAAVLASNAMAQSYGDGDDLGIYIEGGYSYLEIEPDGADSGVDTNALALRLGWQLSPVFSIEADLASGIDDGEFDFNVDEDEFNLDDNNDGDFDDLIAASGDIGLNYLVGAYGRIELPLTDQFSAFARAGYAYVDIDASLTTPGGTPIATIEDSEDGASLGAGAEFKFTQDWALRGDYTWYGFDNSDAHGAMITLGYTF